MLPCPISLLSSQQLNFTKLKLNWNNHIPLTKSSCPTKFRNLASKWTCLRSQFTIQTEWTKTLRFPFSGSSLRSFWHFQVYQSADTAQFEGLPIGYSNPLGRHMDDFQRSKIYEERRRRKEQQRHLLCEQTASQPNRTKLKAHLLPRLTFGCMARGRRKRCFSSTSMVLWKLASDGQYTLIIARCAVQPSSLDHIKFTRSSGWFSKHRELRWVISKVSATCYS